MQPTLDGQGGQGPDQSLLAGAVDLGHPIQQAGRAFLTALAKQGGKSAVFMGLNDQGQLIVTHYTPGGLTELCGIALLGAMTILMQTWAPPQPQYVQPGGPGGDRQEEQPA